MKRAPVDGQPQSRVLVSDLYTDVGACKRHSFFSGIPVIPVHKESPYWFAFQFGDKFWTWIHCPQGLGIFSAVLLKNLLLLPVLPGGNSFIE